MVREAGGNTGIQSIVPFQVTKERCVELFLEYANKVPFLSKELKDVELIQKFTGIYMPFYQYDVQIDSASIAGYKTVERHSNYDIMEHYRIEVRVDGISRGALYDGSRYFDDQVSARSQPYNMQKQAPFNPAYLSGFYADVATVPADLYAADAEAQTVEYFAQKAAETAKEKWGIYRNNEWEVVSSGKWSRSVTFRSNLGSADEPDKVEAHAVGSHLTLLPLWFLTLRKGDRVAYAVVNGESGKVVSDLPLDYGAFIVGSVWTSVVVFVLLEVMLQPTPVMTTAASLLAAYIMGRGILTSAREEWEQQCHAYDKGFTGNQNTTRKPRKRLRQSLRKNKKACWGLLIGAVVWASIWIGVICSMILSAVGMEGVAEGLAYLFTGMALCNTLLVWWRVHKWGKSIEGMASANAQDGVPAEKESTSSNHAVNRDLHIAVAVLSLSVLINMAMVATTPVDDSWYYLGDGIGVLGLVAAAILMIRVYNVSTTRPLPKLFDRAEVQQ